MSIKANSEKWDKVVKQMDLEEEIEEVKQTDFERQRKEYMEKLMGCSKDHSKEIDLYDKTYADKIDRVKTMMQQAQSAFEEHKFQLEQAADGEEDKENTTDNGSSEKVDNL